MMIQRLVLHFILLISFLVSPLAQAYTDAYVCDWVQRLLIETFDARYDETSEQVFNVQNKYSHAAWVPLKSFFNDELRIIREEKLILHPQPITKAVIVDHGQYMGSDSWRVNQTLNLPELHMRVQYSAFVIKVRDATIAPFLIQSIDVKINKY